MSTKGSRILSPDEEEHVASLVCEFFEAARSGLKPDVDQYLAQLLNPEHREIFLIGINASLLMHVALNIGVAEEQAVCH